MLWCCLAKWRLMTETPDFTPVFVRALGPPAVTALFKQQPEDFLVEEELGFEFSGDGEHVYWQVEKKGLTTPDMLARIARDCSLSPRQLSVAGMKDRQACTRQWVCLHVGVKSDPDPARLTDERLRVVQVQRNQRKLKTGSHQGNRFRIVLRQCNGDPADIEERAQRVIESGVPNYFGPQRFGMHGDNVDRALAFFQGSYRPRGRFLQGMLMSAARAWLFNHVLAQRARDANWNRCMEGDLLNLEGSRAWFMADSDDPALPERLRVMDVHPTGPLWGKGPLQTSALALACERRLEEDFPQLCEGLARRGLTQERRPLRMKVQELAVRHAEDDSMVIEFRLGKGGYATAVLGELVNLNEAR